VTRTHGVAESARDGYAVRELLAPDGETRASFVPELGMVCCSLQHRGEELLGQRSGLSAYADRGSTMGIPLLFPWANRLDGTSYRAAEKEVEFRSDLPVLHLDEHGLPIHGALARSLPFDVTVHEATAADARVVACVGDRRTPDLEPIFPFPYGLEVDARLSASRLEITTTLAATGDARVPVAFGYHPYLALPGIPRPEWQIEAPVEQRLVLDDRGIPTGERTRDPVAAGALSGRTFDNGYADVAPDSVFSLHGAGRRVTVTFEHGYPFAQLFAPAAADVVCFEPMTAPANALRSGDGLVTLGPGERYRARFAIEAQDEAAGRGTA
jgi:galactose mutarotase-like enzyme